MATNKRTLSRIGFYCGLALFLIITLFPFFVMLMTSFKSAKEAISLHPTLLPQQWTLEHYVDIFNPVIFPFVDYFRNSMVVSVVSSVVAVFLGILGAYALSRLRFKGRMTINASFYTVYMFSGIVAGGAAVQNHHRTWHLRHRDGADHYHGDANPAHRRVYAEKLLRHHP